MKTRPAQSEKSLTRLFLNRPSLKILSIVLLLAVIAGLGAACGKKGDPEPQDPSKSFTWKEAQASSVNNCFVFSGSLDGAYSNLDHLRLELAAVSGPEDCPGCPFVPGEIQVLSPTEAGFDSINGTVSFTYCPRQSPAYRWRVSAINIHKNLPFAATQEEMLIMTR